MKKNKLKIDHPEQHFQVMLFDPAVVLDMEMEYYCNLVKSTSILWNMHFKLTLSERWDLISESRKTLYISLN